MPPSSILCNPCNANHWFATVLSIWQGCFSVSAEIDSVVILKVSKAKNLRCRRVSYTQRTDWPSRDLLFPHKTYIIIESFLMIFLSIYLEWFEGFPKCKHNVENSQEFKLWIWFLVLFLLFCQDKNIHVDFALLLMGAAKIVPFVIILHYYLI